MLFEKKKEKNTSQLVSCILWHEKRQWKWYEKRRTGQSWWNEPTNKIVEEENQIQPFFDIIVNKHTHTHSHSSYYSYNNNNISTGQTFQWSHENTFAFCAVKINATVFIVVVICLFNYIVVSNSSTIRLSLMDASVCLYRTESKW